MESCAYDAVRRSTTTQNHPLVTRHLIALEQFDQWDELSAQTAKWQGKSPVGLILTAERVPKLKCLFVC